MRQAPLAALAAGVIRARAGLLRGYGRLEQAAAKLHRLPWRLQVLAELKAATLIHCEFCIDLASQIARRSGLSDEQLLALPRYRDSGLLVMAPAGGRRRRRRRGGCGSSAR